MKLFRDEEGQALVLTVLTMTILLGFMALALDVGLLFRAKRHMQTAADAASTAGALDYFYSSSKANGVTAAKAAGTTNGVTDGDSNGDTVTVNCAPSQGPHTSGACNGYFEALVVQPNPTIFMRLFGRNSMSVATRAVAGPVASISCMYFMKKTGTDFSLQGAAKILNPNGGSTCGIYVNSTDPKSVTVTGNGNTIDAVYVATQGDISGKGNSKMLDSNNQPIPTATGAPAEQMPPSAQALTAPDPATMTCAAPSGGTSKVKSTTFTLMTSANGPGCYSGNVMMQGTSGTPLNLTPGVYVFSGPNVAIGDNVTGIGVTFDIYSGAMTVTSTTNVDIEAPTSGTYNGDILIAPDSAQSAKCNTSTWDIQWGAAKGIFDGMIVAPCVNLSLQDQGGSALVTGLVIGQLTLKTGTLEVKNYSTEHPTTSPWRSITLVE